MSQINSLGGGAATAYSSQLRKQSSNDAGNTDSAISALTGDNSTSSGSVSSDQIASLSTPTKPKHDYEADFLSYMKKTPAQRLRDDILKKLRLTEDNISKMSPAERSATEQKIADMIKKSIENGDDYSSGQKDLQNIGSSPVQKLSDGVNSALLQLQQVDTDGPETSPS